tara:strand:- start:447 stop:926 length:480 start_codon:yes stop_codon:yes gene_type:complete
MAIEVKLKTNQKLVSKNYKRLATKLPRFIEQGLKQAGFHLLDIIRTKTSKGQDFRGRPFAPYSEGYLKRLEKEGRPTVVDLIYNNKMMGSLTPSSTVKKTGRNKISLAFSNAEQRNIALFNQVLGNPKREFFAFNSRTENIIGKAFNRFVEKQIRNSRI